MHTIDSELYASWPDWSGPSGRELARRSLKNVKPARRLSAADVRRIQHMVAPGMTNAELGRFVREARFWLEPVSAKHPSGWDYSTAFSAALLNWTMPYRGRSGRSRRFVVVGHATFLPAPVVVGVIEVGDEAPYSTERDRLLVLEPGSFRKWFDGLSDRQAVAAELALVFRRLRAAVQPIDGFVMPSRFEDVLAAEASIRRLASGRSQSDVGHREKKRLAYVVRLAHGEWIFREIAGGGLAAPGDPSLREGIRAVHDLTVPRMHMEVTICGALPPFNTALAGKLVVSFLAHPEILGSTKRSPGEIVQSIFDIDGIRGLLPESGMLALTTKGLYPGHSALYNRASAPGVEGTPITLRKLGATRGESTMLIRELTARLAQRVTERARATGRVALVYGTGGSKRMRFLESAAIECGLAQRMVHAGIKRPVYGVSFVSNMAEVVWRRAAPKWRIDPEVSSEEYSRRATELWRSRWGDRAVATADSNESPVEGLVSLVGHDE